MKKLLIFCLLVALSSQSALAHNPLSAMYYFEVKDDFGILNISLSQAGFQEALTAHYPAIDFNKLSDVDYKQWAVAYVKDNFHLNINGNQIELLNGGLKLGNHQTDLKFVTEKLPNAFHTLEVEINAFRENEHHQTIFSWSLHGETDKVILSDNNDYSASVKFKDNKMLINKGIFNTDYLWFIALVPMLIIGRKVLPIGKNRT
ncbi:MAG: hypothetical protein WBM83_03625 [Flavobacteriaceae bacterium]